MAWPLLPPVFHSVMLPGNSYFSTETNTSSRPPETVLPLGREVSIIRPVACHQGETWQGNTWLLLELSCRGRRRWDPSPTRERPGARPPLPLPTKICSHTCPWPSSWTSQTHAPSSGFGPKSPWMGLTCPGFSVAVCSEWMLDVGRVALLQWAWISSGPYCSFDTCFTSPGPSRAVRPTGDSSVSVHSFRPPGYQPAHCPELSLGGLVLPAASHPLS